MLALAGVHPRQFIEVLHFAGNVHGQKGRVETRNLLHARDPSQDRSTECVFSDPIRAYHAHSGNHDLATHAASHLFLETQIFCCARSVGPISPLKYEPQILPPEACSLRLYHVKLWSTHASPRPLYFG